MGYPCEAFRIKDPNKAIKHIKYEVVENYGDTAYGHPLYVWDDGYRLLGRCKNCGGYVLVQSSQFTGFDGDDGYYEDYYPVSGPEEADELNKKYSGFELEMNFPRRFLKWTNGIVAWCR